MSLNDHPSMHAHLELVPMEPEPLPVLFTEEDRTMLRECHAKLSNMETMLAQIVEAVGPAMASLQGSPIARMLGIR